MKKQKAGAVIVTAYKDYSQLLTLINYFTETHYVIVHISTKSCLTNKISELNGIDGVTAFSKYDTSWGSYQHLKAVISGLELAVDICQEGYVHILSGQDYPIVSKEDFCRYFENNQKIYMTCSEVNDEDYAVSSRYKTPYILWRIDLSNKIVRSLVLNTAMILSRLPFGRKQSEVVGGDYQII